MTELRSATADDALAIGEVHVSAWRSAYAGLLPDQYLARLSAARQAAYYERAILNGAGVHVITQQGDVVGFSTARRTRNNPLGDGEIETLYVLDDYQGNGFGRALLGASALYLAELGCASAFVWVLRENPASFFYAHLGGKRIADSISRVGGNQTPQTAFCWNPIETLLAGATL
ncbi:MAG: hypothetical protein B7Z75_05135 [Acidocella sp. 20-57-95]|nr:MAG: hypothetical protein B7Z75_05135 [Acidocella sp. 20-57-95]OYV57779.1 MAG: hypothetical protein B7Z71_12165 [Acidocella sp. 21-58-7]HQT64671.1 GNAT family N-acetyltransferase [Acidocella sp.]HQU05312.1 GNAT family N-acetyltransferase [Acidocella sp.]